MLIMSENSDTLCESNSGVLNSSNLMSQNISVGSASSSAAESSGQNPLKKQIDPLELLNCLSILLNSKGGIKSIDEVQRVAGLMGKYSKKLVSKCIYLNILQATEEPLLDDFYKETGWNLVCSWLTEAMLTKNYPLAEQILSLLLMSPATVDRLKRNNMPKMVKDLSKDCPNIAAQETAEKVVQQWKELVKGYTAEGGSSATSALNRDLNSVESSHSETSNTSESMKVSVTNPIPLNIVNSQVSSIIVNKKSLGEEIVNKKNLSEEIVNKKNVSEERETAAALSESSSHDVSDLEGQTSNIEKETQLPIPKLKIGRGRGSPGRGSQRGAARGRARRKRGATGVGRGRGKNLLSYAELLCQDIDSTYDDNRGKTSPRHRSNSGSSASSSGSGTSSGNNEEEKPAKEGAVPPLRITIKNGVSVLRPASNVAGVDLGKKKRLSIESTDSDDNKPLSIIRDKCQKSSSPPPPSVSSEKVENSNSTSEEGKSANDVEKEKITAAESGKAIIKEEEDEEEEIIKKRKKGKRIIISDDEDEVEDKDNNKKLKSSDKEEQVKPKKEVSESELKKKKDDNKAKVKEEVETPDAPKVKEEEKKKERKMSSSEKSKIKPEKDKERDEKRSKEKEKYKEREKDRSKHKSSKDRDRERDRDKDRDRDRNRDKDKYRDRDKDKKGDKKREKERRRDSDEKEIDSKRKEQIERDKATLDKIKPLSTQGLSKIPRKTSSSQASPKNITTPVSFLDALGAADSELQAAEGKRSSSLIKTKSRGFRNTGLLDETIKPPGVAGKRLAETLPPKQKSSIPPPLSSANSSTIKISPSSAPPMGDRPGGVKLISPKRPVLADDGGFMAALTAVGVDRKKIVRKRKSSDSDSKSDTSQSKILKTNNVKDTLDEPKTEEGLSPNGTQTEEEVSNKTEEKENIVLSPTSIKPTFNFYKETLNDNPVKEETKPDSDATTDAVSVDEALSITSSKDEAPEEVSADDIKKDEENMEVEESSDANVKEEPMEIAGVGDGEGNGDNTSSSSSVKEESTESNMGSDSDFLDEAPVPAPAQEDYEKVEVTFAPARNLKGVLVYHRPQSKKKKGVKWKAEADLKEIFYFPMDETERVNVNTIKFNEMMMMEKAREKEFMFGKNRNRMLLDGMNMMMDNGRPNNCIDFGPYKLYPVHLPNPSNIHPGSKSVEKQVQAQREHATMATFFHPAMLPDSPSEPDPEMVTRVEPLIIPLKDVTGSDSICDNRGIQFPEPLLNPPDYSYMAAPPQHQQAPHQHGGGHWVLGNHTVSRFSGGPSMFGGHGAPPQGPGNNPGFAPPPQGYPGDMRGGWGGPSEFSGPPVLMPNGPPPMGIPPNIGGPTMHGGPPLQGGPGHGPGPGPGMSIGGGPPPQIVNRDNYPRYRRGGSGSNWGGHQSNRGYCKHFRNGNCRHGDDCKFLHVPS